MSEENTPTEKPKKDFAIQVLRIKDGEKEGFSIEINGVLPNEVIRICESMIDQSFMEFKGKLSRLKSLNGLAEAMLNAFGEKSEEPTPSDNSTPASSDPSHTQTPA